MPNSQAAAEVLKNAHKIKDHKDFSKFSIAPDLTQSQREERKHLVPELKARKDLGEDDLVIQGDKIVKRRAKKDSPDSFRDT